MELEGDGLHDVAGADEVGQQQAAAPEEVDERLRGGETGGVVRGALRLEDLRQRGDDPQVDGGLVLGDEDEQDELHGGDVVPVELQAVRDGGDGDVGGADRTDAGMRDGDAAGDDGGAERLALLDGLVDGGDVADAVVEGEALEHLHDELVARGDGRLAQDVGRVEEIHELLGIVAVLRRVHRYAFPVCSTLSPDGGITMYYTISALVGASPIWHLVFWLDFHPFVRVNYCALRI